MAEVNNVWICKNCSTEFKPTLSNYSCPKCKSSYTMPKVMKKSEEIRKKIIEENEREEKIKKELESISKGFLVVTTPSVSGYSIKKVFGLVSGLSPRTRGVGGSIVASLEATIGGEITAFTLEIEKARVEAVSRAVQVAVDLGANAIIGLDIETSSIMQTVMLVSATGTAVEIIPELN